MEELSIEEKAKRYDEAIEKLRQFYRDYDTVSCLIDVKEELANLFPELAESEDDRIRKALIKLVKKAGEGYENVIDGVSVENAISWLEKQGEQNHAWSESDERKMRYIENELSCLIADEREIESPLTKRVKDLYSALYWLKSLKDRVQPQQERSKENENNILFLTSIIEECFKDKEKITLCSDTACANFTKEDVIDRLKSLRHCSQWKPSDEQIKILNEVLNFAANHESPHWNDYIFGTLNNLIRQLKKLREE